MTNLASTKRRPSHLAVVGEEPIVQTKTGYPVNVIAVWSGVGSPGRTTVAINLATELSLAGKRTLLIDLDTLAPAVALTLGLVDTPAGLSAVLRLVEQGRLSAAEFERLTVRIELGRNELLFMPGLSSPRRWPEVSPERLEALLAQIAPFVDYVVLDLAQPTFSSRSLIHPSMEQLSRDQLLESVLSNATRLLTVSGCDPVAAKRFLEAQELLQSIAGSRDQFVVVNRFRTAALGANAEAELSQSFEALVRLRIDALVPEDTENIDRAMRNGLPLALLKRSSPARQAIAELTKLISTSSSNRLRRG